MIEDGVISATSVEQTNLEERITDLYRDFVDDPLSEGQERLVLHREQHVSYLHGGLQYLPSGFIVLDSSRPWICYWIVHSLALLEARLPTEVSSGTVTDFLALCQDPEGGFGGGPMQLPHLAPTYAAIACLVTLGGEAALSVIHKQATLRFLQQRAVAPEEGGGFTVCEGNPGECPANGTNCNGMQPSRGALRPVAISSNDVCAYEHAGGEVDVRGCYTAMAAAHMLNLDKHALALKANMVQYVKRCQVKSISCMVSNQFATFMPNCGVLLVPKCHQKQPEGSWHYLSIVALQRRSLSYTTLSVVCSSMSIPDRGTYASYLHWLLHMYSMSCSNVTTACH